MKPRYKRNSPTYIRLQAYEMYRDGLSFYDIAAKFHISHKRAEDEVLAYVKTHNIDTGELESRRYEIAQTNHALAKANHSHIESFDIEHEYGYGFKDASHTIKTYSDSDLEIRLPEPHLKWFDKVKLAVYHFFFFWK